jgi:hypothetical protein
MSDDHRDNPLYSLFLLVTGLIRFGITVLACAWFIGLASGAAWWLFMLGWEVVQ